MEHGAATRDRQNDGIKGIRIDRLDIPAGEFSRRFLIARMGLQSAATSLLAWKNYSHSIRGEGAHGGAIHITEKSRLKASAEKGNPVALLAHGGNLSRKRHHRANFGRFGQHRLKTHQL
jgi:hypothetical protein